MVDSAEAAPTVDVSTNTEPPHNMVFEFLQEGTLPEDQEEEEADRGPGEPTEAEGLEEPEEAPEAGQTAATDGEEEPEETLTFDQVAKAADLTPEQLNSMTLTTKIGGVEAQVPLVDVVRGYQIDTFLTHKRADLDARLDTEMAALRTAQQDTERAQQFAETMIADVRAQLQGDLAKTNWQELLQSNPQEYTRLVQQATTVQQQLDQYSEKLKAQILEDSEKRTAAQQQVLDKQSAQEETKLLGKLPEWTDDGETINGTARAEMQNIGNLLRKYGFEDGDLAQLATDHRLILVARDAMRYATAKSNQRKAKRVPETTPKRSQQSRKTTGLATLERTGNFEDALGLM